MMSVYPLPHSFLTENQTLFPPVPFLGFTEHLILEWQRMRKIDSRARTDLLFSVTWLIAFQALLACPSDSSRKQAPVTGSTCCGYPSLVIQMWQRRVECMAQLHFVPNSVMAQRQGLGCIAWCIGLWDIRWLVGHSMIRGDSGSLKSAGSHNGGSDR